MWERDSHDVLCHILILKNGGKRMEKVGEGRGGHGEMNSSLYSLGQGKGWSNGRMITEKDGEEREDGLPSCLCVTRSF